MPFEMQRVAVAVRVPYISTIRKAILSL